MCAEEYPYVGDYGGGHRDARGEALLQMLAHLGLSIRDTFQSLVEEHSTFLQFGGKPLIDYIVTNRQIVFSTLQL